jgi:hypothetical protein
VLSILPTPFRAAEEEILQLTAGILADAADPESFSWCSLPETHG